MQAEIEVLIAAAVSIAFLHTVTGPDHYLPFIVLSKTRDWSFSRTIFWTVVCGCGHVWSSVLLGLGGAAIGWSLSKISWLEGVRGGIAGWVILIFGLVYAIWGAIRAKQNLLHKHFEVYDEEIYVYEHKQGQVVSPKDRHVVTPWVMFLIFVLGPCEPMIPLLYFPAAQSSWLVMLILVLVYTVCTLSIMIIMVVLGYYGISILKTDKLERYVHAFGGLTIFICGLGMVFLEW